MVLCKAPKAIIHLLLICFSSKALFSFWKARSITLQPKRFLNVSLEKPFDAHRLLTCQHVCIDFNGVCPPQRVPEKGVKRVIIKDIDYKDSFHGTLSFSPHHYLYDSYLHERLAERGAGVIWVKASPTEPVSFLPKESVTTSCDPLCSLTRKYLLDQSGLRRRKRKEVTPDGIANFALNNI